jgi:AcrR family transcriptional regulator
MTRQTADERRESVLAAAIAEFGARGYHGTPTEAIAKRAGISHAYLFRLYGTKKELFIACADRCFDRTTEAFRRAAAEAEPGDELRAMGRMYVDMLGDRELLLLQLQVYAAADDDDIRAKARERYAALREEIRTLSKRDDDETLAFMGQGMLLNNAAAMGLDPGAWVWGRDGG